MAQGPGWINDFAPNRINPVALRHLWCAWKTGSAALAVDPVSFYSHHSWKAVKRATSKEGTTGRILRKKRFSQAQNFSMGLSSGEYGGRNRSLQPAFWAAENNRFLEWNEALSITITVPLSREGRSWLENQNSKRLLSIVPLYWNGERILSAILAATMPQRLYFRPLIRPNTCCPRGAYPYSRYKYVSMPHSST